MCLVHIACEHDHEDLVRVFLGAGAAVDAHDKNGCTPLFTSVRAGGSPAVLQLLLDRGAAVDAAPDGEPTSLALASGMGCLTTIRLLVRALSTLNHTDNSQQTNDPYHVHDIRGSAQYRVLWLSSRVARGDLVLLGSIIDRGCDNPVLSEQRKLCSNLSYCSSHFLQRRRRCLSLGLPAPATERTPFFMMVGLKNMRLCVIGSQHRLR